MSMANSATVPTRQLKVIRIDQIRILNPRARNQRHFSEIVKSIEKVGLKRPITVSPRVCETDSFQYDLVCGQGRIEAFVQLGQVEIPAMLIEAEESDCLVMSLVENCARRQHRAIDLLEDINTLRKRGYDDREIAEKIGVTQEYIRMLVVSESVQEIEDRVTDRGMLYRAFVVARRDVHAMMRARFRTLLFKALQSMRLCDIAEPAVSNNQATRAAPTKILGNFMESIRSEAPGLDPALLRGQPDTNRRAGLPQKRIR